MGLHQLFPAPCPPRTASSWTFSPRLRGDFDPLWSRGGAGAPRGVPRVWRSRSPHGFGSPDGNWWPHLGKRMEKWVINWLTLKEIVTSLNLTINWGSYIGEFANKKLMNMEFPGRSSSRLHPLCQLTAQRPQVMRNLSRAWQPQDLKAGTLYFIFPTLSELPSRAASEDFATWILSETKFTRQTANICHLQPWLEHI